MSVKLPVSPESESEREPGGTVTNGAAPGAVRTPPRPEATPVTTSAEPTTLAPLQPNAAAAAKPTRRRNVRRILFPVLVVLILVGGFLGYNAWHEGTLYVSTDNAQITGQPVQVGAMNAGRIDTVHAAVGTQVHKGDVLAQVALPSQVGVSSSGTPRMGFTGAGDARVDVLAPFDGMILAVPGAAGATVQAGQAIVTLIDPNSLYVYANIEETNVRRLNVGQVVAVHVDALGKDLPGRIESITPATAATFSLLPASNASGNFNKVTQDIPVRIAVNLGSEPTLVGSSVEVKIRVAE